MTQAQAIPKVAIIGAGAMGRKYLEVLRDMPVHIVAFAGRSAERAQQLAEQAGAQGFAGHEALLDAVHPDILFVCSPTDHHFDALQSAIDRGVRAVYCEKPLTETLEQAEAIAARIRDTNTLFGIGFKMRYESIFAKAHELIAGGDIGQPISVHFNYFQTVPDWAHWYLTSGAVREILAHPIDLSNWLMGRAPLEVHARKSSALGGTGEDRAMITIKYGDHQHAHVIGGWIRGYPELSGRKHNICFHIVGDQGYMVGIRPNTLIVVGREYREYRLEPVDPFPLQLRDFLECYHQGLPGKVGLEAALDAQKVIEGALRS